MDLLRGYGSDDSESSSSSSSSSNAPRKAESSAAAAPASSAAPTTTKPKTSRVGKRIVSLHAVLPAAIRDRLTKSVDDNDSSSDEEVEAKPAAKSTKSIQQRRSATSDAGLSLFLSELQSTTKSQPTKDGGPMGLSLVSAKTTVVRGGKEVEEHVADERRPADSTAVWPAETPAESKVKEDAAAVSVPRSEAPVSLSLPRVRQAAPPIVRDAAPFHSSPAIAPAAAAAPPIYQPEQYPTQVEFRNDGPRKSKKRQRQELEKALRQGQLSAVDQHQGQNTTTLEAQDYSHAVAAAAPISTQHGVKKGTVRLYDAHQGTDVVQTQVSAKHRSKHQINQLMASAVNLEAQRAREAGLVKRTSSTRADAKRKYGW